MPELDLPSGRFVLRIDRELHAVLRTAAQAAGLSLNEYCARRLAGSTSLPDREASRVVEAAAASAGAALAGVIVFGSWARSEAGPGSDVDVLIVLDPGTRLHRGLYAAWDEQQLTWDERRVEPHFVVLPEPERRVLGLWAEAAIDGLVLFERDLAVSRRLALVRRDIADGRIQLRHANGQTYWVEAA